MKRKNDEIRQRLHGVAATLIALAIVAGVVFTVCGGGLWVVAKVIEHAPVAQPPAMNAPLMDIVRWCTDEQRESYTYSAPVYNATTKKTTIETRTAWRDSEPKFHTCMQRYEYTVKR